MGVYTIKTPDGQTMQVEGPDGATDDEIISFAQSTLKERRPNDKFATPVINRTPVVASDASPAAPAQARAQELDRLGGKAGVLDAIVHGASFGLDSKVYGAANALSNVLTAPFTGNLDPGKAYTTARDANNIRLDEYARSSPVTSVLGNIVGGFVGGRPTGVLTEAPNILAAMRSGAKAGAVTGALSGSSGGNDLTSDAVGAGVGGVLGGALGGAAPAVVSRVSSVASGLNRFLGRGQGDLSRELIGNAIAADGLTPGEAGASLKAGADLGVPRMLADLGENTRALASSVARQPGPSRTIVRNAVIARQEGQGERVRDAITRDLGPINNTYDVADALMKDARDRAGPLYDAAYATPGRMSDELQSLLQTPTGKQALSRAYRIAADERRNPAAMGLTMEADGSVRLNPAPVQEQSDVAAARGNLDAAQQAYREARNSAGGDVKTARDRLETARERLRTATSALAGAPVEGEEAQAPAFTVQTLDYVKRGIDDVLNDKRSPLTGRLVLDEAGRAIEGVRRQFVREVDKLHPGPYAEARSIYAGPAAAKDALMKGEDALNASADDIGQMTKDMTPFELSHFGMGFRKAMGDALDSKVVAADKVGTLLGSPAKQKALAQVFGGEDDFNRFLETLRLERQGNETYRSVATGSQTAGRLADDAQNTDDGLVDTATDALMRGARSGGSIVSVLAELAAHARNAGKFGVGEAGNRVREGVASLLTETDPATLLDIVQRANRVVQSRALSNAKVALGGADAARAISQGLPTSVLAPTSR